MSYRWKWIMLALVCNFVISASQDEEEHKNMVKRQINSLPLVYPYGATYKLIIGLSAPIKAEDYISLAFAANFQYQYSQFQNISEVSRYYFIKTVSREQREADLEARKDERYTFYRSVADMLRSKNMDGDECVFRAICEAAQYPVEEEGLVGEILHILLTPDYGKSPFDEKDQYLEDLMSPYNDAAIAGRQMFNCPSIYPRCPEGEGLMEMFSVLREE
ncbi:unnamed protein product [Arctia plantaginis]|uniref:Uncharacterized protein n=1 Tax=Arctia plantaginis TaxID=874455 RepID=A0A8S1AEN9_ARCPL|nr:unnamed protein product [Arctia plantaginis]CAB3260559.1 unnamed protein product [Arctia plantaginis]